MGLFKLTDDRLKLLIITLIAVFITVTVTLTVLVIQLLTIFYRKLQFACLVTIAAYFIL
jgi:hypothetical protein